MNTVFRIIGWSSLITTFATVGGMECNTMPMLIGSVLTLALIGMAGLCFYVAEVAE